MYSEKEYNDVQKLQNNKNEKLDKIFNAVINDVNTRDFFKIHRFLNHENNNFDLETNLQFWNKETKNNKELSIEKWYQKTGTKAWIVNSIVTFIEYKEKRINYVEILTKLAFSDEFIKDVTHALDSQYKIQTPNIINKAKKNSNKMDDILNDVLSDESIMSFLKLRVFLNHKDNNFDLETNLKFFILNATDDRGLQIFYFSYDVDNLRAIADFIFNQDPNIDYVVIMEKLNIDNEVIQALQKNFSAYKEEYEVKKNKKREQERIKQEALDRARIAQQQQELDSILAQQIQNQEIQQHQQQQQQQQHHHHQQHIELGANNVMTHEQFDQLPEKIFTQQEQDQDEKEGCIVCNVDYKAEDVLKILSCNHLFHKACIEPWLTKEKNNCPKCRKEQ